MGNVPAQAVLSARYMTRFRCLAGDCEATCCGGGAIPVEESTHRHLTLLAQGDRAALDLLEHGIERTPGGPDFAHIRFLESGDCSMRDERGLCRVHARFGHQALFEVCATYPRYASEVDDAIELFGTLACPEVARLALLADDAFELSRLALTEAPRVLRNRFNTTEPYFKPFKAVRSALVRLISEPGYALPEKLFVMLWMADKLKGVLHRGCGPVSPMEMDKALAALSEPEILGGLAASYRGLALDGALPCAILIASLSPPKEPRHGAQTEQFDAIWREVEAHYGAAVAPGNTPSEAELRAIWTRYGELYATVPREANERVDLCLLRYAVNHVLTTPYMLSGNVFEYAYELVVRLACLRFLLTTRFAGFEGSAAEVDQRIVQATFSFVRSVEHSDWPGALRATLHAQHLDGLAHAACFLALWCARKD